MKTTRILTPLIVALALGLAACGANGGSNDGNDGVATLDDGSSSNSGDDGGDGGGDNGNGNGDDAEDIDEQIKQFEKCMTDHGVDLDDMGVALGRPGGGIHTEQHTKEEAEQDEPSPAEKEAFDKAREDCEKYMPTPELSPEDEAEMKENALAYVECLRDQGYDVPDPKVEGGGMGMSLDGTGIDPEDPAFQAADQECMEKHMGEPDLSRRQEAS